jgi:hypothetical protein
MRHGFQEQLAEPKNDQELIVQLVSKAMRRRRFPTGLSEGHITRRRLPRCRFAGPGRLPNSVVQTWSQSLHR